MKLLIKTILATLLCLLIPTLLFAGKKKVDLTKDQIYVLKKFTSKIIKNSMPALDNDVNNRKRKAEHSMKERQIYAP